MKKQLEGELASYAAEKPWRERQEMEDAVLDDDATQLQLAITNALRNAI